MGRLEQTTGLPRAAALRPPCGWLAHAAHIHADKSADLCDIFCLTPLLHTAYR
jgi:hypothetical protein